jgi:hypothetical protein
MLMPSQELATRRSIVSAAYTDESEPNVQHCADSLSNRAERNSLDSQPLAAQNALVFCWIYTDDTFRIPRMGPSV